jgi:hypothetical protein
MDEDKGCGFWEVLWWRRSFYDDGRFSLDNHIDLHEMLFSFFAMMLRTPLGYQMFNEDAIKTM